MEKKSLTYALAVFIATSAALFLLYDFFLFGLPAWFVITAGVSYFLFTIYNAEAVMGLRNALVFQLIVVLITFTGEAIGSNWGWFFGSYHYTDALGIRFLGVPLIVIMVWDIYVYTAYMLVSHIVNIRFTEHLVKAEKFIYSLLIALLTGLATTAADFVIDPIAVVNNLWVWHGGGLYFESIVGGVPVSNFLGWILLSSLAVFLFKFFFEKPFVEKETLFEHAAVIPYLATFIIMIFLALLLDLDGPALVGGFSMGIFLLFYIVAVITRKLRLPHLEKNK